MATEAEILRARRERASSLAECGIPLFPARVPRSLDRIGELRGRFEATDAATLDREGPSARVAGRIVGLRSFGKAAFGVLQADGDRIQIWLRKDLLGGEDYANFRLFEIGDFMWASGRLMRTRTQELTLEVRDFGFLAKSYRPLPEKFHGLQDLEARTRMRYLDLIVNPEARRIARARSRTVRALREVLDERSFLEVETPVLQPIYGGGAARPFTTYHHGYDQELYLRISFELYLKRLLIGGLDRVYEIGRDFRNEGVDRTHNPEFSMLEAYQAYADYTDMMELCEALVAHAARQVNGDLWIERAGRRIDLSPPWPRRSMTELIAEASGIDIERHRELGELGEAVRSAGLDVDPSAAPSWARLVDDVFSAVVEPGLIDPMFVVDYPVELSPLAKRCAERPHQVERFEAYLGGTEICNAFSELNDPDDQRARMLEQVELARAGDPEANPLDEDFLLALEYGMPPSGGLGLGVGRLVMMLTGALHLREVKLFPHARRRSESPADRGSDDG